MFRKKKKYVEQHEIDDTLASLAKLLGYSYRSCGEVLLKGDSNVGIRLVKKKLDLILKHLELEYVPETTEPAKLEKKRCLSSNFFDHLNMMVTSGATPTKPKKKRGRPKKK